MVQMPAVTPVTLLPLMLHTSGVVLVRVTALPDAPPLATTLPVPPTDTVGAPPKIIVCDPGLTVMFCVTCGAAE